MSSCYLERYFVHVSALFLAEGGRYQNKMAEIKHITDKGAKNL